MCAQVRGSPAAGAALALALLLTPLAAEAELPAGDLVVVRSFAASMARVDSRTGEQRLFPSRDEALGAASTIEADRGGSLFYIRTGHATENALLRYELESGVETLVREPVECCGLGLDEPGRPLVYDLAGVLLRIDPATGAETPLGDFSAYFRGDIAVGTDGEIYVGLEERTGEGSAVLLGVDPVSGVRRLIRDFTDHPVDPRGGMLVTRESGELLVRSQPLPLGIVRLDAATGEILGRLAQGLQVAGFGEDPAGRIFASVSSIGFFQIDPVDGSARLVSAGGVASTREIAIIPGPLGECRDGIDNDGDGDVDFPADAGCEHSTEATELADSPLDVCEAEVPLCEDELDALENDLAACGDEFATALAELQAALTDSDSDGVRDAADACPGSAASPVDALGCTHAQFCATYDGSSGRERGACRKADWLNDEPAGARDCRSSQGSCLPR